MSIRESHHSLEVIRIDRSKQTIDRQRRRVINVINHALEPGREIGELEFAHVRVRRLKVEPMRQAVRRIIAIDVTHEIGVTFLNLTLAHKLVHARVRHRVEVAGDQSRDLGPVRVRRSLIVAFSQVESRWQFRKVGCDLLQLVHEHSHLNKLDIPELVVPVNVRVGYNQACARLAMLKQSHDGNVVLRHHPIEHVFRFLEIGSAHCDLVELDQLLLNKGKAGMVEQES